MKKHRWTTGPVFAVNDTIEPALSLDASSTTKRKRASKPKVRTGCITWIRRVKCDETKPACTRCTSTGRKCDGYGGPAPPRRKKLLASSSIPSLPSSFSSPPSSTMPPSTNHPLASSPFAGMGITAPASIAVDPHLARRHELARHSFATACRGTSALRILRPLAADIEGTEQERIFFHRFRRAAEDGLAMHASSLGSGFWRRLVPRVGHSDPAVRHALIALGAAYQSAQLQQQQQQDENLQPGTMTRSTSGTPSSRSASPDAHLYTSPSTPTPPPFSRGDTNHDNNNNNNNNTNSSSDRHRAEDLELFTIQQYNLSIYHLQRHAQQPGSAASGVEITLICCLVFVCIETSRGNSAAALAHVANGLQIIKAVPSEAAASQHGPDPRERGRPDDQSTARISRSDWRLLVDFFRALEPNTTTTTTYGLGTTPTPPCPPDCLGVWTPPLETGGYDELILPPQWGMGAAAVEII
ncbi:hypothetical protein AAE478_000617 [Parahypoxylon ruwenzoriense]